MSLRDPFEGQHLDCKSLRIISGKTANFEKLSHDCVCFANGSGGRILIGIEDGQDAPPPDQKIDPALLDTLRKRIAELTVNVTALPAMATHANGGEYIELVVQRGVGVASTSDGRYFIRIGDACQPLTGDDIMRLADERQATPWETMASQIRVKDADSDTVARLIGGLHASERVKASVKEKSDGELLDHYNLSRGAVLTNLGVLLVGKAPDRAKLGSAPIVQAIRRDERDTKVGKHTWDDHTLSPIELLDAIWDELPEFSEAYDLPQGMIRQSIPAFDKEVIRELLVNAFVHRPYTQRGDIFLNFHPDRLEVVNPGRLPLGVTPKNVLHESRRRNEALARIFHDLKLMEREGSGFDLIYEKLLTSGRKVPTVREGIDSVHVTVPKRVIQPGVISLLADVDERYQLTQREHITLGLLAQGEGLSARELAEGLALVETGALRPWLGRLVELGIVRIAGRGRGVRYYVPPELLRSAGLDRKTTLVRIEPHRLRALVLEDIRRYPGSSRGEIHPRIGSEISVRSLARALTDLTGGGAVIVEGKGRWTRYRPSGSMGH